MHVYMKTNTYISKTRTFSSSRMFSLRTRVVSVSLYTKKKSHVSPSLRRERVIYHQVYEEKGTFSSSRMFSLRTRVVSVSLRGSCCDKNSASCHSNNLFSDLNSFNFNLNSFNFNVTHLIYYDFILFE